MAKTIEKKVLVEGIVELGGDEDGTEVLYVSCSESYNKAIKKSLRNVVVDNWLKRAGYKRRDKIKVVLTYNFSPVD